jgi:hypothetical protein
LDTNDSSPLTLSRKKEMLFKSMLLVCSTLFTLVLFEIFLAPLLLAILGMPNRELTLLQFTARPNTQVADVKINSQGFTGVVLTKPKPPKTIRILTLGGSAMFDRRMTERLTNSLANATSTHLEVVGGALRSHTTRDSEVGGQTFTEQSSS